MNALDRFLMLWLNHFAHRSAELDVAVIGLTHSVMFCGGLVMLGFWWAWFRPRPDIARYRAAQLATLVGAFAAIVLGRLLAVVLPFRYRPLYDGTLHFVPPYGIGATELRGWSSFPSDHAMMFFEIATGVTLVNRPLGVLLLLHACFVVCLPRVYAGLHYPSDVAGGALIGIVTALVVNLPRVRDAIARPLLLVESRSPSAFYGALFLLSFEVAEMFTEPRALLSLLLSRHHGG